MKLIARYKSDGPFIATQGATKGRRYEIIEDASGTEAASMEAFATANHYRHAPSGTYVPQEVALWAVKAECAARMVFSMSRAVWAVERNAASNCDGAK